MSCLLYKTLPHLYKGVSKSFQTETITKYTPKAKGKGKGKVNPVL